MRKMLRYFPHFFEEYLEKEGGGEPCILKRIPWMSLWSW